MWKLVIIIIIKRFVQTFVWYLMKQHIMFEVSNVLTEQNEMVVCISFSVLSLIAGKNHYGLRNSGRVKFWHPKRNEYKLQVGD